MIPPFADNPLFPPGTRARVVVAHAPDPYAGTRQVLTQFDLTPAHGKRVLLKPNAGRVAPPGSGINTHPQVVAAAIDAFREAGAIVSVGESPITGVATPDAFEATGIADVARERECPLLDMDENSAVRVDLPEGVAITSLQVCPEVFDHDIIVSMPVAKMHMHTGVSLAVKNMKGCLWRRSKVRLHMLQPIAGHDDKPINIAIADMAGLLRPHFAIVDGTTGMEGLGPSAGDAKELGVVVAGTDAFAADAVTCRLMGTRAEDVPHLRIGAERGYGVIDMDDIDVTPDQWQSNAVPFARPPENLSIEFPNVTVLDRNSCSACQSTLLLFLRRYGERLADYFPAGQPVRVAIGKGHEAVPAGTLCVGNCTARHRDQGIFVKGCPPVGSEILQVLTGSPTMDGEPR